MSVRTMFLALSTTALLGCASTPATATRTEAQRGETEAKTCSCDHKTQEGSAQAAEGHTAGCSCPHCGHAAKGTEGEAAACSCSHEHKEHGGSTHGDGHQG
jgi:hypothetical protein